MTKLKVIKKDGSIEDYDINQIINACNAAGLTRKTAKKVSLKVNDDLYNIPTSKIRELILNNLRHNHPETAKRIIQYDIRKDKKREEYVENYTF
ncbi:MAG: hypothetical protein EU541_07705 [Promethearchaeota archaeon]|nr:MAG: hypothetical protein EU541_07705 [Candidatus Lokiarchaeota archaeon]